MKLAALHAKRAVVFVCVKVKSFILIKQKFRQQKNFTENANNM